MKKRTGEATTWQTKQPIWGYGEPKEGAQLRFNVLLEAETLPDADDQNPNLYRRAEDP